MFAAIFAVALAVGGALVATDADHDALVAAQMKQAQQIQMDVADSRQGIETGELGW